VIIMSLLTAGQLFGEPDGRRLPDPRAHTAKGERRFLRGQGSVSAPLEARVRCDSIHRYAKKGLRKEDDVRFGILGSGIVGRTIAGKLSELDHDVAIGTRDVDALMARTEPDAMGNPPFSEWRQTTPKVEVGTYADIASQAEMVVNATSGAGTLEALDLAGVENLSGKVLIDIANPLDYSRGMPPSLFVSNTDSLAERIQRTFPDARVVKTLNTMNARVMVDPAGIGNGDHNVFLSGDDSDAKAQVADILRSFGWRHIIDLGGIVTARSAEMYLPLWLSLMGNLGTPMFNIKVTRGQ
jgi:8-hydroxy-5-deazaflavin:NADPH oxidoreductase